MSALLKRGEWHERAREMAADGMNYAEIGRALGVTRGAVRRACNPEQAKVERRRSNAKRNAAKRAWDREHYRGECEICGVKTSSRGFTRCFEHSLVRDAAWRRKREIVERWAAGESLLQIAAALGTTKDSISVDMVRMRREGWDLPFRHHFARHDQQLAA